MALTSDVTKPDSRIPPILTSIEKLKLEVIKNQVFLDQDVYLDGREFVDCSFKRCRMFVKLGNFLITVTGKTHQEMGYCEFVFLPPASAVRDTIMMLLSQKDRPK
jgi:hypothetical protein